MTVRKSRGPQDLSPSKLVNCVPIPFYELYLNRQYSIILLQTKPSLEVAKLIAYGAALHGEKGEGRTVRQQSWVRDSAISIKTVCTVGKNSLARGPWQGRGGRGAAL